MLPVLASLPTKPDLVLSSPSSGGPSLWPLVQALFILGVLFALVKWGGPKLVARLGKKLSTGLDSPIQLQEAAQCGVASLQVVEVRGRTLLLASGPQGVSFLTDLTEVSGQRQDAAFFELLDQAEGTPERAVVELLDDDPVQESQEEALSAYERLARLTEGSVR
ncbi:MAG: hypothetical protein KF812_10525 [Fimbriimonadaceae bacterium]|nr:hypothetical protein [Fimbriimonadaceae bacterium]